MARRKRKSIAETSLVLQAIKSIADGISDQQEKGPERDYVACYDGTLLFVGSEAVVGRDEWGYEGIGQVIKIDGRKNRALIKFYPWLSPGFRYGSEWYGGEMLRLDKYKVREQQ